MINFFSLSRKSLEKEIESFGKERYRATQLFQWVYRKGMLDFISMTNLSKDLRGIFQKIFNLRLLPVRDALHGKDGTIKFGFEADDGHIIESVFIPEKERNTLCISSQIGCRMGCTFCVTGRMGFIRNLSVAEIIGQVMGVRHYLKDIPITNLVFMGMGEPVDNMENLIPSLEILKDPAGLDFSYRRITISSAGLIEGLKTLEPKSAGIAISLNASDNATRTSLMPINRLYPIEDIMRYVKAFKGAKRTRVTFEYVMLKDINDALEDAQRLSVLLKGVKCKINLIPYNESPYLKFKAPDSIAVERFHEYLLNKHFTAIVRASRGQDIWGGCGQLGMRYLKAGEEAVISDK